MSRERRRLIGTFAQAQRALDEVTEDASRELRRKLTLPFAIAGGAKGATTSMHTGTLKENVREMKDQALHHAHEARDRVVQASRHAAERMDEEAHRSPWVFVGVAALFSAILGFLLGRSSRR